jgi:hypothetical protein
LWQQNTIRSRAERSEIREQRPQSGHSLWGNYQTRNFTEDREIIRLIFFVTLFGIFDSFFMPLNQIERFPAFFPDLFWAASPTTSD